MNTRTPYLGLLRRRQCVVPTWRGWLVLLLVIGVAGTLTVRGLYGFLAVNEPLPGGTLVIEGWSLDYVLEGAVDEYRKGHYGRICLTGGPIEFGNAMREHKTYAEYAKAMCIKLGVPADAGEHAVVARPACQVVEAATCIHLHIGRNGRGVGSRAAHSRRTRLVYEKALGMRVGISNIEEMNFDPKRWWTSSSGVRIVLDELIAYTYARFLFSPPKLQP